MSLRILLVALLIGLGVHHVAPLMPGHGAQAGHEVACTTCTEDHGTDGAMEAALLCMGILAVVVASPRLRRRGATGMLRMFTQAVPARTVGEATVGRAPPPPRLPPLLCVSVLRC